MNVVVTGAAGFLGSTLVRRLLDSGDSVLGIDDYSTGDRANWQGLEGRPGFRTLFGDVCEAFPDLGDVDVIFHLASPASPVDYAELPIRTLRVNSLGTEQCCKLAVQTGARLVFASTSEVYGDPLVHPQPETYWGNVNPNGERSCYDEGKRYGEAIVAAYRRAHGIDGRIVRIFNTYGPRMRVDDGRLVPALIMQALVGAPFTIYGNGRQTRCLCYVDDLIDGLLRYAGAAKPVHAVMNLGSDHEVTVDEVAREVAEICEVPVRFDRRPARADDPARRRPDLSRARETIGWSPATPLRKGLASTVEWFGSIAALLH